VRLKVYLFWRLNIPFPFFAAQATFPRSSATSLA
jgi:hypothetical protein